MPTLYLETTIISYLAARPADNITDAARQLSTHQWWERRRAHYELFTSAVVSKEAQRGDPDAAMRRTQFLVGIPELPFVQDVTTLAQALLAAKALPAKATDDALHIALAAVHGVEFLLTWNFKHIANAMMRAAIETVLVREGWSMPLICTPDELLNDIATNTSSLDE
jgi:predicted nucleic acid-binding protein